MISIPQIELNVCLAYQARIRETFPVPTYESEKFLLILRIYEWQLKRRQAKKAATWDELATLKHGVRQAEWFIHELQDRTEHDDIAKEIHEVLWEIVVELTQDIMANEALYPELKPAFNREREQYRRMKEEAEETLNVE